MENVAPGTMRAVSKELRALNQDPIEGVSVLMNESDLTDITAHIAGPSMFFIEIFCNCIYCYSKTPIYQASRGKGFRPDKWGGGVVNRT